MNSKIKGSIGKKYLMFLICMVILGCFCKMETRAENSNYVYLTKITLPSAEQIEVGESTTLSPTLTPFNATNKSLYWSSSNTHVVTVDLNGNITGNNTGTAIIKATAEDGSGIFATTTVKVVKKPTPITINKKKVSVTIGKRTRLKLNGVSGKVQWKSSKPSVATVTSAGVVKGKKIGKAKITAKYNGRTYTCAVTVKSKFEKGVWYGYSNGGFYFWIKKINGNKMKFSVRMPNMSFKNKMAKISSNGKTAAATVKCKNNRPHKLNIAISGSGIRVTETSNCSKMLLSFSSATSKRVISHKFHEADYFYE